MNKFFILLVLLGSSILSAEDIVKIKQDIPTIVKVQVNTKISNCKNVLVPSEGYGTIEEADVTYQLDRDGKFSVILNDKLNIDVSHCVSRKDKENFYKRLLAKAAREKKNGNADFDNFLKLALDDSTRFFLQN